MPVGVAAVNAYVRGLDGALADRLERYRAHLETQPLAVSTRRTYASRVGGFLAWLAELDPETRRRQGDPFGLGHARDYAVRDYRAHLVGERLAKPSSVNLTLAALDHFFRWVGLGPARVRREELAQAAPRALSVEEQRRLLRAAERGAASPSGVRDRAVLTVLLFTGLRIAELVALNTGDVAVSARKGVVTVRRGKGERYRTVPLNAETREVLDAWLRVRAGLPGAEQERALWLSLKGARLSMRAVDLALRRLGAAAEVEVSAHVLRHTCLTGLVRAGHDIVLVAELAGHARLETTRRYSLPSDADRQAAMDGLTVEY